MKSFDTEIPLKKTQRLGKIGELWSFHPENCGVFIRRIVEFSLSELWSFHSANCGKRTIFTPLHTPTTPYYQGSFKNHETHEKHETHETPSFRYYLKSSGTIPRDDDIRAHSCPFVVQSIRAHSCTFVVLGSFRVFRVFRGSSHSRPFAPIRIRSYPFVSVRIRSYPFVSVRVHSYPFVSVRNRSCPFVSICVHSWF